MDLKLLEAASDLGATPWKAVSGSSPCRWSKAGIIAGSMLVFIPCVGRVFVDPLNCSGGPQTLMIGPACLWDEFFKQQRLADGLEPSPWGDDFADHRAAGRIFNRYQGRAQEKAGNERTSASTNGPFGCKLRSAALRPRLARRGLSVSSTCRSSRSSVYSFNDSPVPNPVEGLHAQSGT